MNLRLLLAAAPFVGFAFAFSACIGEAPLPPKDTMGASDGSVGSEAGPGESDAGARDGGAEDAPPDAIVCGQDITACSGKCVDLANDNGNCGRCGRSCGGGKCTEGLCSVVTIRSGLGANAAMAVGPEHVFFVDGMGVRKCPISGCKLAPEDLIVFTRFEPEPTITASDGTVVFAGANDVNHTTIYELYNCPSSGCASLTPSNLQSGKYAVTTMLLSTGIANGDVIWAADTNDRVSIRATTCSAGVCTPRTTIADDLPIGLRPEIGRHKLIADATNVYFFAPGDSDAGVSGGLKVCARSGCGASPTPVALSFGLGKRVAMGFSKGQLMIANQNWVSAVNSVLSCTLSGTPTCKTVSSFLEEIVTCDFDDDGFVCALDDEARTLFACPPEGCGVARKVIVKHAGPPTFDYADLVVRGGFVYWLEKAGDVHTIRRVARP